jgi:di/tricarboxylate transporter
MAKKGGFLIDIWQFAKAILRDRQARRRFLAQLLFVVIMVLVLGNWPLRDWVEETKPRFLVWWGGTAFFTIWMLMLAMYDALRVRKEILEEEDWE